MDPKSFVHAAVLLLIVAATAVALFRHFGLGSILGLLVTGILIGPHTPGPTFTAHVDDLRHFTELGVVLLLFVIGLEVQPRRLWELRRTLFGLGTLQVALTGLALAAAARWVAGDWSAALLIGLSLALSSTALVMQTLYEQHEIATRHGQTAFSVLLLQDLAVVPLLALLPVLATDGPLPNDLPLWEQLGIVAAMLALVVGGGRWLVPRVLDLVARQGNREAFFLVVMAAVFIAAGAMDLAGMSMALGAFLMGAMLSGSRYSVQIHAHVEPHKGLLMSLFFVAVGMSVDLGVIAAEPLRFAAYLGALLLIKIGLLYGLARLFGSDRADAVRVAFMLGQAGEFGFILFGTAKALSLIDDTLFASAVTVISISMLLTPLLMRAGNRIAGRLGDGGDEVHEGFRYSAESAGERPPRVVVAGYGRVGHTIGAVLSSQGIPYIAFDANPAAAARWRGEGLPVHYGDIRDPHLLEAAKVQEAEVVVLTLDDTAAAIEATTQVRAHAPAITIVARARDLMACDALFRAGASKAFPEVVEASLRLAAETLEGLGVPDPTARHMLQEVRGEDYALVRVGLDPPPIEPAPSDETTK